MQRIEVGQGDDGRAGTEILADIHLAHAKVAGEGRAHQLLGDDRLDTGDVGLRHLEFALVLVDGLLRHVLL